MPPTKSSPRCPMHPSLRSARARTVRRAATSGTFPQSFHEPQTAFSVLTNRRLDHGIKLLARCRRRDMTSCAHQKKLVAIARPIAGADLVLDPDKAALVLE